jgi:hypothetical protein
MFGSGEVGRKLFDGLIKSGYTVKLGTSDPDKESHRKWLERCGEKTSAGFLRGSAACKEFIAPTTI